MRIKYFIINIFYHGYLGRLIGKYDPSGSCVYALTQRAHVNRMRDSVMCISLDVPSIPFIKPIF